MIFVDDGSTDDTYLALKALKAAGHAITIVRFRRNYGQTAAMQAGFEVATGSVIVTLDGDLQNDPADIPKLIGKLDEGYDLVCGWRLNRHDSFLIRTLPSRIANRVIRIVTGIAIHDNGCSLKAYNATLIKRLSLYGDMHRFIPAVSSLAGARVAEVVVTHHARKFGVSKYGIGRTFRVLFDLLSIRMITRYACHPLLGFCMTAAVFFCLGLFLAIDGLREILIAGSIPLSISLVGSSSLFLLLIPFLILLGLIGEMAVRTGNFHLRSVVLVHEED
jgi:glycosyltransferase involved in cell wall biosynthesis